MIRIGLNTEEKQNEVNKYIKDNKIKDVIIFHPDSWITLTMNAQYVKYSDIVMYKVFYPLLEKINNDTLLIFDECMRTNKREDLTYNCAHHYCNQTQHKIVFEYYPIIDKIEDFMILADLDNTIYKHKKISEEILNSIDIKCKENSISIENIVLKPTDKEIKGYYKKKESLFKNLGQKDPNTIPRELQIYAGKIKKPNDKEIYIARNKRYKKDNVYTYNGYVKNDIYYMLDFPIRHLMLNDFIKKSKCKEIIFINSGLKVDAYYYSVLKEFIKNVGDFIAKTDIYR